MLSWQNWCSSTENLFSESMLKALSHRSVFSVCIGSLENLLDASLHFRSCVTFCLWSSESEPKLIKASRISSIDLSRH